MNHSSFNDFKFNGQQCTDYLIRNIRNDGSFYYQVNTETNKISNKYNVLRHAGTLYELCIWLSFYPNNDAIQKLKSPFVFLLSHLKQWKNANCIVENNDVKLGGSALALLALTRYYKLVNDESLIPHMTGLANFLLFCQEADGGFISKFHYRSGLKSDFKSAYYPGQAVLALIEFHSINPDVRWTTAAYAGLKNFLDKSIKRPLPAGAVEHWFAKALSEILKVRYEAKIMDRLDEIVDANIQFLSRIYHQSTNSRSLTSASVACAGEALVSGLKIYLDNNKYQKVAEVKKALDNVIEFCLDLQVNVNDKNGSQDNRYNGGIVKSRTESRIRIDYVQHSLSVITSMLMLNDSITLDENRNSISNEKEILI